jgi:hypothetical protein
VPAVVIFPRADAQIIEVLEYTLEQVSFDAAMQITKQLERVIEAVTSLAPHKRRARRAGA